MQRESMHLSEWIDQPAQEVYRYAADPANLPAWAPGLGSSVEEVDGQWFVQTVQGRIGVAFVPRNEYGVLDHYVTLPSGQVIYVPLRVIADGGGGSSCELVFSLRRLPGMTDAEFSRDAAAVAADLARLKQIVQGL